MRFLASITICFALIFFSCTDRDDNLEGVQLRVLNTANTTFTNVIIADSLVFSDVQSGELTFYQEFDGIDLPQEVMLTNSSLTETVSVAANTIEIDTTILNLITYRIGLTEDETDIRVNLIRD